MPNNDSLGSLPADDDRRPRQEPLEVAQALLARQPLLQVQRLHPTAKLPVRGTPGAAGLDLYSIEELDLAPRERMLVRTGIAIAMPVGIYGRIASRSGLAVRRGLDVCAGVVDSDFRGEVKVLLMNNSGDQQSLPSGTRIAQLILECYIHLADPLEWSETLPDSIRGEGGYGSTGLT